MIPKSLDLESFVSGCSWSGIPSLTIKVNGAAPASALSAATMRFIPSDNRDDAAVELSNTNTKITIVSAANWQLSIPKQIVPGLTAGKWKYQLVLTAANGDKDCYVTGNLPVLEHV
jgi:hypothetical protein